MSVSDDGHGIDPRARTEGLGLIVLAERLSLVDGELTVDSSPGAGTTVTARAPI